MMELVAGAYVRQLQIILTVLNQKVIHARQAPSNIKADGRWCYLCGPGGGPTMRDFQARLRSVIDTN